MILDAVVGLAGIMFPPVFDFIKKKFIKPTEDTVEATLSSLATTKPDIMPAYIEAIATKLKAEIEWFNRDVIGTPSQWIVDLRAAIRPVSVVLAFLILLVNVLYDLHLDPGTRISLELNISSWFGSRLSSANRD